MPHPPSSPEPAASHPPRSGTVALAGRANAGKSTLLNALVGVPLAAVSDKPQTTRTRVLGVVNGPGVQATVVDTPGLHRPRSEFNRRMVATAEKSLDEVDCVCWVVDATRPVDEELIARFTGRKVVVALNKVDLVNDKTLLLPMIAAYSVVGTVVPVSATRRDGLEVLVSAWAEHLPEGEAIYPDDQATPLPEKAIVAELVREQLVRNTGQELPYATAVEVERFDESRRDEGLVIIHARIVVEKPSQKAIVIGAGGRSIKRIGTQARKRIEKLLGAQVHLQLFVAVEEGWTENPRLLADFGYTGE